VLECAYWDDESEKGEFDIMVNEAKIATETLFRNRPGSFFERRYPLPPGLPRGKSARVTVKLLARPGTAAGGLFGLRVIAGDR